MGTVFAILGFVLLVVVLVVGILSLCRLPGDAEVYGFNQPGPSALAAKAAPVAPSSTSVWTVSYGPGTSDPAEKLKAMAKAKQPKRNSATEHIALTGTTHLLLPGNRRAYYWNRRWRYMDTDRPARPETVKRAFRALRKAKGAK